MADWFIRFMNRDFQTVGEYSLMEPNVEIRNSEPGGFTGEIALSQTKRNSPLKGIKRDEFRPYATLWQIWRQNICIDAGELTSLNLNFNRDTALIGGRNWIGHLQRRVYPFDPEIYKAGDWVRWPRKWPDVEGTHGPVQSDNPVDVSIPVRQLIQSMRYEPPTQDPPISGTWPNTNNITLGSLPIKTSIPLVGKTTKYQIYPGDSTTIYDHVRKLSEQTENGFEYDITPRTLEFKLWAPRRDSTQGIAWYVIKPSELERDGALTDFDWTNEGPNGTYLVGLGAADHRVGAVFSDEDSVRTFGRHDRIHDFGQIQNPELILDMVKDLDDLHAQKTLQLELLNPEFLPLNFYRGGRPRNLLGSRIRVKHDFKPLHLVQAFFRINAIKWRVDQSTNEYVGLELKMVYGASIENPEGT